MFRPRLVNTINWRFQDVLTKQKHLKVFYKQTIMLKQIKFQLKINSGVRELLSRSSQGHWDGWDFLQAAMVQLLLWDLLGKTIFAQGPRSHDINIGKMFKIILAEPCHFKWGN